MHRDHFLVVATIFSCIILFGVVDYFAQKSEGPEEPVPTEPPVVLSAASVNLTEQDYAEMEQIRVDIRKRLIEHPDPELYSEIEERLNLNGTPDQFYVSCIPFLSWSYEEETLAYGDNLGIWAFDDQKRDGLESNNVFLLVLDRDETGKLHVTGSYTQTLDSMEQNPSAKYLCIWMGRVDEWGHYFLREDEKVYDQNCSEKECVQLQGDFCKRFDWDRMAVCYEEIVNSENLAVFQFR